MNRREFLGGALAAGGFWAVPGAVAAASPVRLRFGVVSDVHVREGGPRDHSTGGDTWYFSKALRYFKDRKVDAVLIAGDIADAGRDSEMESVAKAWFEVFPEGCGVEKLFVSGNHDWSGQKTIEKMSALWETAWHEPYVSLWHKTVKGYHFVGKHWDSNGFVGLAAWLKENGEPLKGGRPFFYVQHPHPRGTCNGEWAWGRDGGATTKALQDWPNAVTFSGHSHLPLTDGRCVWRGGFTSISASSLSYVCMPDGKKRRNAPDYRTNLDCRHGMVVDAYDDRLVIERRDFVHDEPLGDDLVFAMPTRGSTFEVRAFSREELPAFPRKAGVSAAVEGDALVVRFLGAFENPTARPYEYRVSVEYVLADGGKGSLESRWFQSDACFSRTRAAKAENVVTVPLAELPEGAVQARVRLTPMNCYGGAGKDTVSDSVRFKSRI